MTKSKKNSIIAFPDDFVVLDIETTGLSPSYDSIIEISALKVKGGNVIGQFSSLTKPDGGFMPMFPKEGGDYLINDIGKPFYYVCEFISNLTGITNAMLDDAPDLKNVLEDFIPFISDSVIVGHNVSFDINFLKTNCSRFLNHDFNHDYIDTMRIARKLFKNERHHRLRDITGYLNVIVDEAKTHRGLYDCEITLSCYNAMYDLVVAEYGTSDPFIDLFKKSVYPSSFDPRALLPNNEDIDETNPFYNRECIFTGALERLVRKEAQQIVVNLGGSCGKSVTKTTNYLILGNNDYCQSIKDGKSSKHKKAESLKEKGMDIEIITEDVFYNLAGIEI